MARDNKATSPSGEGRKLTITDIARLAGVSKKTVSRVINHSGLVKAETRDRILKIVAEHDFRPDPQARALALRRSHLIAFISNQPNPNYIVSMQSGILEAVSGTPYEIVIRPCDRSSPDLYDDIEELVTHQKLFGVILTPSISEDDELIGRLGRYDHRKAAPYTAAALTAVGLAVGAARPRAAATACGLSANSAFVAAQVSRNSSKPWSNPRSAETQGLLDAPQVR